MSAHRTGVDTLATVLEAVHATCAMDHTLNREEGRRYRAALATDYRAKDARADDLTLSRFARFAAEAAAADAFARLVSETLGHNHFAPEYRLTRRPRKGRTLLRGVVR